MGNWSDVAKSTAIGSGVSAASGLIGGIMSMIGSRRQYKNQKKLMAIQNNYDIAAFEREKEAQKELSQYMAVNSNPWLKTSLQNAGYSTADPNGTGVQTAGVSAPSMDVPGTPTAPYVDYAAPWQSISQSALAMAQIANLNADTKKKGSENDIIQLDLQNYRDTYQERVNTIKSEYYNLTKQNKKLDSEIDNLAQATANIEVDTRFKEATFDANKEKLFNELSLLVKENKIKQIESKLADYGIILGASDIGTILSIAASNKGAEAAEMFGKFIGSVVGAIPRALGEMLRALWDEATK